MVNYVEDFFHDCLERNDDRTRLVSLTNAYEHYRQWHRENYVNECISKRDFRARIQLSKSYCNKTDSIIGYEFRL